MSPRLLVAFLATATVLLGTQPSSADSIDGKWCSEDGRRIEIAGSRGIWGRGLSMSGEYLRYTYAFEMPAGEPEAGERVEMRFRRADQNILVRIGNGEAKVWRKCQAEIS